MTPTRGSVIAPRVLRACFDTEARSDASGGARVSTAPRGVLARGVPRRQMTRRKRFSSERPIPCTMYVYECDPRSDGSAPLGVAVEQNPNFGGSKRGLRKIAKIQGIARFPTAACRSKPGRPDLRAIPNPPPRALPASALRKRVSRPRVSPWRTARAGPSGARGGGGGAATPPPRTRPSPGTRFYCTRR